MVVHSQRPPDASFLCLTMGFLLLKDKLKTSLHWEDILFTTGSMEYVKIDAVVTQMLY